MIFILLSMMVPIVVFLLLPWALEVATHKKSPSRAILITAGVLFFLSWYLPSPEIQGNNTAAVTHFVGGGIFTGFVWLYIKRHLNWQVHWLVEILSLLAMVSMLGVANELFELAAVQLNIIDIPLADAPWDLLMNTLGAFTFWLGYKLGRKMQNF
jgi:hypothetical protein